MSIPKSSLTKKFFAFVAMSGEGLESIECILKAMPLVLAGISAIGTAAMLWVGGSIVILGLEVLGWSTIGHDIHDLAAASARMVGGAGAVAEWTVTAGLDGVFGIALGLMTIPLVRYLIAPVARMLSATYH